MVASLKSICDLSCQRPLSKKRALEERVRKCQHRSTSCQFKAQLLLLSRAFEKSKTSAPEMKVTSSDRRVRECCVAATPQAKQQKSLQASLEMAGLTKIVQSELELQITQIGGNLLAALRTSLPQQTSASFLSARQPNLQSGFPAATNVRVMASDEPFPTISSMVEDLVRSTSMLPKVAQQLASLVLCRSAKGVSKWLHSLAHMYVLWLPCCLGMPAKA